MDAAALEPDLDLYSPGARAALDGHASGLESPMLLHSTGALLQAAGGQAGVSLHTTGLVQPYSPAGKVPTAAGLVQPLVPVSALGTAAPGTMRDTQPELSDDFVTAREQQTLASGAAAGLTPQSTAASRPSQVPVAVAAGRAAAVAAAIAASDAEAAAEAVATVDEARVEVGGYLERS